MIIFLSCYIFQGISLKQETKEKNQTKSCCSVIQLFKGLNTLVTETQKQELKIVTVRKRGRSIAEFIQLLYLLLQNIVL